MANGVSGQQSVGDLRLGRFVFMQNLNSPVTWEEISARRSMVGGDLRQLFFLNIANDQRYQFTIRGSKVPNYLLIKDKFSNLRYGLPVIFGGLDSVISGFRIRAYNTTRFIRLLDNIVPSGTGVTLEMTVTFTDGTSLFPLVAPPFSAMKIGTQDPTDIRIGSTPVQKMYVGDNLVWER